MKDQMVSYAEFLQLRRDSRFIRSIPEPFFCREIGSVYLLTMNNGSFSVACEISDPDDIAHFTEHVHPFCNKLEIPSSFLIKSHDFTDESTWIGGAGKSLYVIQPSSPGKESILYLLKGKIDETIEFATGQKFCFTLWQTTNSVACPAVGDTPTTFADVMYNPGGGVFTGWYKAYPTTTDVQEVTVWVHFTDNVMDYRVAAFEFTSLDDLKDKADVTISGGVVNMQYKYSQYSAFVNLRSSLNERIEVYINDHSPFTVGTPTGTKNLITAVVAEYDEF